MLAVAVGLSPVVAFGAVAWWAHARSTRVKIVNLCEAAPANKRSSRRQPVDAVVLHQMAFSRGNDLLSYRKVTAHFVVTPDGTIGQLHPVNARLSASHGFNSRSVAIEFAGNLRSVNGNWWRPETYGRDTLTREQIEAGRKLLMLLKRQGIRFVLGHRQSDADRGNDPGPEIWSSIAQWGIEKLRLSDGGPEYSIDTGRPIPESWRSFDPSTGGNS
ncbi:peptidoglycan recognition protein family protein [Enhygromyxa salina]|uniref:N-acetylmuramoyl-L-alanine amidase n=1 Tax=Enhygromyxa salina TaxID=215803 RepID=A0A2S9YAL6_9BACT|nr:peptidoglycan recognition family protein [Enhygromyxa salina]PRQ02056.1 N-acetylmuramoyl-L-alanine amidase [Enhygromyxa salina]